MNPEVQCIVGDLQDYMTKFNGLLADLNYQFRFEQTPIQIDLLSKRTSETIEQLDRVYKLVFNIKESPMAKKTTKKTTTKKPAKKAKK